MDSGQDADEYEEWKHWAFPHLLETLQEFPSVAIDAALLVSQLPLLQPRFYSISSSPLNDPQRIDITAAVIAFKTQGMLREFYPARPLGHLMCNVTCPNSS